MAAIKSDVVLIGGGAAGLAAAVELARKGRSVTLLEARERLGGRIFTVRLRGWGRAVELGAQFVHEGNPVLWNLIRRQGLKTKRVVPRHWLFEREELKPVEDVAAHIGAVTRAIKPAKIGRRSFASFLQSQRGKFSPEESALAAGFIEGFEAAPLGQMSARSVAGATLNDEKQFILPNGYDEVVEAMAKALLELNGRVWLGKGVRSVTWRNGAVTVRAPGLVCTASAVVVTVPLGVLKARPGQKGALRFEPRLVAKEKLVAKLHMGHVVRLAARVDARRWRTLLPAALRRGEKSDFGFLHSRISGMPVWWSLSEGELTGWAGGPAAMRLEGKSKRQIVEEALGTLGKILGVTKADLRRAILGWEMHHWAQDPFSRGAYSFATAGQDEGPEQLRVPVQGTVFFAGEATADGEEIGTVHGAMASGVRAAREVMAGRRWITKRY